MEYFIEEELLHLIPGLLSGLTSSLSTGLLGIAVYVLTALAVYSISVRRGLRRPWLAWIPVANVWLLGSLSDQYQYVVKGENKARRKWLVVLNILKIVLVFALIVLAVAMVGTAISGYPSDMIGLSVALLGLLLPLGCVSLAFCVIRYMALYDVYRSLDPDNAVLYLVLSILFSITEPFFLFFNREKDLGMPPRKQQPVYTQDYTYETVENVRETVENREYL